MSSSAVFLLLISLMFETLKALKVDYIILETLRRLVEIGGDQAGKESCITIDHLKTLNQK